MTDYLQELLDNAAALMEQVRRLERSGSGRAAEEGEETASPSLYPARALPERQRGASGPEEPDVLRAGRGPAEDGGVRAVPRGGKAGEAVSRSGAAEQEQEWPPERTSALPEEEPEGASSLLEQVLLLERAAPVSAGTIPEGRSTGGQSARAPSAARAGYPDASGAPGTAPAAGIGLEFSLPGGGPDWAEQADRVFRRDSRRYDGGFYLY